MWNIQGDDFEVYDDIWKDHNPRNSRSAFVNHSTGPHTEIETTNVDYYEYILDMVQQDFDGLDEEDAEKEGYTEPRVAVLGCYLPEGRMIPQCGRTPLIE